MPHKNPQSVFNFIRTGDSSDAIADEDVSTRRDLLHERRIYDKILNLVTTLQEKVMTLETHITNIEKTLEDFEKRKIQIDARNKVILALLAPMGTIALGLIMTLAPMLLQKWLK